MQSRRSSNTIIPGEQPMEKRHWDKPKEVITGKSGSTDFLVRVIFRKNTTWQGEIDLTRDLSTAHIGVEFADDLYDSPGSEIIGSPEDWGVPQAEANIYINQNNY